MGKIDNQMITLYEIVDNSEVRQYSAVSGDRKGIATYLKKDGSYIYEGDNLQNFTDFVKDTLVNSVLKNKNLPQKIVHGFG
ncbi:hypothetical protein JEQ21_09410 [Streptococcus sp. 121]|uniref:hypothetical protein n=1 Tax=Streptococcus sp. 121 TaxID=2797637 RepID=UPI0018F0741E|nr:hypothetical protein [Streptococcus sp. 121]MBJ6746655.1 hypothetical protein [Streptococcus sp. 121]